MKKILFFNMVFVVSLFNLVCLTSCIGWTTNSLNNGYKLFTLTKGIGHFSLEFPKDFSISIAEINNSSENTYVHVNFHLNPPKYQEKSMAGTLLTVLVSPPDSNIQDAKADYENVLSSAQKFEGYQLIEKFELDIVGSHGYGLVFSWTSPSDITRGSLEKPITNREIVFEKHNLLWYFSITSDTPNAQRDKIYFDHVLQSLKILN